jgi:hypothetical protein
LSTLSYHKLYKFEKQVTHDNCSYILIIHIWNKLSHYQIFLFSRIVLPSEIISMAGKMLHLLLKKVGGMWILFLNIDLCIYIYIYMLLI